MVIRGNTRGNGGQLADYVVTAKDNDRIEILEVDGVENADVAYLKETLESMSLMEELTKSNKGLYHAQINPAYGEDLNTDWYKAADMLGEELGLDGQRRVIVLHEKKGRTHAHVVWERYDHETGTMKSDSFSRLAQDRARKNMELAFGHKQTPHRNPHRPELKMSLTQLWNQTGTGAQFAAAVKNNGYMLAAGAGRNPFMVVDENGRSFNLVRQLQGVRLKDVRQRMRHETLVSENEAIRQMRLKAESGNTGGKTDSDTMQLNPKIHTANKFGENSGDMLHGGQSSRQENDRSKLQEQFDQSGKTATQGKNQGAAVGPPQEPDTKSRKAAKEFATNAGKISKAEARELKKQKLIQQQKDLIEKGKRKFKHLSIAAVFMLRLLSFNVEDMFPAKKPKITVTFLWREAVTELLRPAEPIKNSEIYSPIRKAYKPTPI